MKVFNLNEMWKGWFIGNFEPTLFETKDFEIAVKKYSAGEIEPAHYHEIATEFTVIIDGIVKMNRKEYNSGDIIIIYPGEVTDFEAVTDTHTVVVKVPSAENDKFIISSS